MDKKTKKLKLFVLLFVLFIAISSALYFKTTYDRALKEPNSKSKEIVYFEIIEGETIETIIPSLINQDLLKEEYQHYFMLYIKKNNIIPLIQAGAFEIPKNLNIKELAKTLTKAQEPSVWITIQEGLRADEIAEIVAEHLPNNEKTHFLELTENQEFIQTLDLKTDNLVTLEGFFSPDKYLIPKSSNNQEVIEIIVGNFKEKAPKGLEYEDLILASIIEREAYDTNDRYIISGILKKRIQEQWLLQLDTPLLYEYKDWTHKLSIQEKEKDTPYNTHKFYGLPPQPICNPSLESIKSAVEPKESNYYYFFYDENHIIHYSKTIEEHEEKLIKVEKN